MKSIYKAFLALGLSMSVAASADDGDDYAFALVNKSSVSVVSFQGNGGGKWSKNWLAASIKPGERKPLRFDPDATENCALKVRVMFDDDSKFEEDVDFCKVTNLVVNDDSMWTE